MAALLYAAGLLFFGFLLILGYFWNVLAPGIVASALLFIVVLLCTGTGRIVLRQLGVEELSESERTLIGCTIGLGLLTQCLFLLGIAGLFKVWAALGLLGVLWVLGYTELRDVIVSLGANRNLLRDRPYATAGILALLGATFLAAWAPPHQYDALVYHLPLAAAYVRTGRIAPVEGLLFSHFPQNGELLFALGLLFKSDALAQLFSWLACALSVLWVFEIGKREMPLSAALGACALTACHTAVMLLASIAYVETLVMLWITAAVLSFCRWREVGGASTAGRGWLALSALFAGLGLGTKYYAGICPAVLASMIAGRWLAGGVFGSRLDLGLKEWRSVLRAGSAAGAAPTSAGPDPKAEARDLLLFCGLAAAAAAPWLLKNWYYVGNPVFPFLYSRLPHRGVPWGAENAARYFQILTEYGHRPGQFLLDMLKFPFLAASGSPRFGGGMDALGDLGWGPLFALLPAALWAAWKNRALRLLLAYCALHAFMWFSTGVVLRFLTVLVPLWSLPAAAGLLRVWNALERNSRYLVATALAVLAVVNLGLFFYVQSVFSTGSVLFCVESRDEFLSRRLDYYPCARYARDRLGKNDKILLVGEQRGYYVEQDHVVTTPMAPNRFVEWADVARDPAELARLLSSSGGFTHLMIVPREAGPQRLGGYGIFDFTERGHRNWMGLSERLKSVFASPSGGCALFELRTAQAPAAGR